MEGKTSGASDRVYLLLPSPDAPGGIARATATLANELARSNSVEMIGVRRHEGGTRYPLDPRVRVSYVLDHATPSERLLVDAQGEADNTEGNNVLVDQVLPRVLGALKPGVVISTRPALHLAVARHAPAHCTKIAHEHSSLQFRAATGATDILAEAIGGVDKYVVLTEADASSYRQLFPAYADRIRVIRNPAPWPVSAPTGKRPKVVVAVGRLGWRKGFSRLIEAYRPIPKRRPHWQLHIYGEGPQREALEGQIDRAGLRSFVFLKGRTDEMEQVLEEASILALTSKYEGMPMVLIEAMTKGVPVVSVDCPNGPAEIVVDGVTGRLVPNNDVGKFRNALLTLMADPDLRTRMSEESLKYARRYDVEHIARTWQELFESLHTQRALAPTGSER